MLRRDGRIICKEAHQSGRQLQVGWSVVEHGLEEHLRLKPGDSDSEAALVQHPRHGHIHRKDVVHGEHTDVDLVLTKENITFFFLYYVIFYLINNFEPVVSHLSHLGGEVAMGQHHTLGHSSGPTAVGECIH